MGGFAFVLTLIVIMQLWIIVGLARALRWYQRKLSDSLALTEEAIGNTDRVIAIAKEAHAIADAALGRA